MRIRSAAHSLDNNDHRYWIEPNDIFDNVEYQCYYASSVNYISGPCIAKLIVYRRLLSESPPFFETGENGNSTRQTNHSSQKPVEKWEFDALDQRYEGQAHPSITRHSTYSFINSLCKGSHATGSIFGSRQGRKHHTASVDIAFRERCSDSELKAIQHVEKCSTRETKPVKSIDAFHHVHVGRDRPPLGTKVTCISIVRKKWYKHWTFISASWSNTLTLHFDIYHSFGRSSENQYFTKRETTRLRLTHRPLQILQLTKLIIITMKKSAKRPHPTMLSKLLMPMMRRKFSIFPSLKTYFQTSSSTFCFFMMKEVPHNKH